MHYRACIIIPYGFQHFFVPKPSYRVVWILGADAGAKTEDDKSREGNTGFPGGHFHQLVGCWIIEPKGTKWSATKFRRDQTSYLANAF
jgi:hypothetical protein